MKNYNLKPLYSKTGTGTLGYKVSMPIRGEMEKVWDYLTKAENIKRYFTTDAKKDLNKPGEVLWAWGEEATLINVLEVVPYEKVVIEWNGNMVDYKIRTEFNLKKTKNRIVVRITEDGWENDEIGIKNALSNCSGWSDFLNALKVYTEHKISYLNK
jgi:uncharacterized protein YndB with AHSA1/START domain